MLHRESMGSGPDLFLLHGWGMHGGVWERLAASLSGAYRVTVAELPGHGRSRYGIGGSLEEWADACLEAAPDRAVWIGWSLGGTLALEAALRSPQRVRALVPVSATPRFVQGPDWPHAMPAATLTRFREALEQDPAATLERFLALQVKGDEQARPLLRLLRGILADRSNPHPGALDDGLRLLQESDLRARLAQLAVPSLWLFGERDTLVPRRWAGELPRLLPGARLLTIPGAAHLPFLSHPRQCASPLRAFLQELP